MPGMLVKPTPNRGKYIMGEDVDMGIHHKGKPRWDAIAFRVINGWEIRFQHKFYILLFRKRPY